MPSTGLVVLGRSAALAVPTEGPEVPLGRTGAAARPLALAEPPERERGHERVREPRPDRGSPSPSPCPLPPAPCQALRADWGQKRVQRRRGKAGGPPAGSPTKAGSPPHRWWVLSTPLFKLTRGPTSLPQQPT